MFSPLVTDAGAGPRAGDHSAWRGGGCLAPASSLSLPGQYLLSISPGTGVDTHRGIVTIVSTLQPRSDTKNTEHFLSLSFVNAVTVNLYQMRELCSNLSNAALQ